MGPPWTAFRMDKDIKTKLAIIDQIEQTRQANNINWMDLLRLAFTKAPQEAKAIVNRINKDDQIISKLLKELAE